MAVLGRVLLTSAERLDLPDLLSIDSYSAGDWKYFMDTLVGEDTPYIIKGFEVINPAASIGTQNISVEVADSAMYYPGAAAGSFYYGLPVGNPNALPLVPQLRLNATNYVYITMSTFNTSEDTRAFWDPDANGGVGDEFTEEVDTESVIEAQINVSTGSFPDNTVPIAIVVVGALGIISITDARPMMFRLGTGGISPNPTATFIWPDLPTAQYAQLETPITITSSSGPNPFEGGDKNLLSLKNWMDAVMSKLAQLGGTTFWYEDTSTFSLVGLFNDLNITFYSKGKYIHSSTVPGKLTLTENLVIKSTISPVDITIQAGTIQIPDEYVVYLDQVTDQPINVLNEAVSFTNGQAYINSPNGSIGYFANLHQGDWITQAGDAQTLSLQVEQFYSVTNPVLNVSPVTTPANAKSIIVSGLYQGPSGIGIASYTQGIHPITDLLIQSRSNPAISAAGGDFLWLALRSDTIEGIASISSVTVSGILSMVDGSAQSPTGTTAEIIATAHGLVNGDRITVTAPAGQAGTYTVDVVDVNTFFINTIDTSVGAFTGYYGLCTTAATTSPGGFPLESATNGFESGEMIIIAGTTSYNAEFTINSRTPIQFEFPLGALAPSSLLATLLGSASSFAVLGATPSVTNTGNTIVNGDLGIYPAASVTGFPPGTITGLPHYGDATAQAGQVTALAAYNTLLGMPAGTIIAGDIGGLTKGPGTYTSSSTIGITGTLTLDAGGNPNAQWIFQIGSAITTAASSSVVIINGGSADNVFWQVGSSATIGASSTFLGTILAHASITVGSAATLNGGLFALTGTVTLIDDVVSVADPGPAAPTMGAAAGFAVLAGSTITNAAFPTVLTGNVGLSPGSAITGFPPGTVVGTEFVDDPTAVAAQIAASSAYAYMLGLPSGTPIVGGTLDGLTLFPGLYTASSTLSLAASGPGTLILSGAGVYIFQVGTSLTTGAAGIPTIMLTGGATANNIYWQVGSAAHINQGTAGTFYGTVIANTSIDVTLGGTISGSLMALTGAVTFAATTLVTVPAVGPPAPPFPPETNPVGATATLARLDVRSEEGITKVVQGETIDIGESDSDNIQRFVGMSSLAETHPDYFIPAPYNTLYNLSNYNSLPTDNLTIRAAKLTAMMADKAQDKTLKYLTNATSAINTANGLAQQLTFEAAGSILTILQPGSPGNAVVTLPSSGPGISLLANQSAYVVINRNFASTPAIVMALTSAVPIDENVIVIASRLSDSNVYLWNGSEVVTSIPLIPSGASLIKVTYYDPLSVTLPVGTNLPEDGFFVNAGDTILFSNLSSGNNEVYMANGTGTTITSWTPLPVFDGLDTPTNADTVIIENGNGFHDQIGTFDGTLGTWTFNLFVRYFNGADYWEQSAIFTSTLDDNTVGGTVTSFTYAGSENMIIDYSLTRGSNDDTASLYVTTDGTNVNVTSSGSYIGSSGVIFSGSIVPAVGPIPAMFNLLYTTTSTGTPAVMKFMIRRWSNATGGPAGVPSYSGASSSASAGGPPNSIQYNNGGLLDGSSNFLLQTNTLNLAGLQISILTVPGGILNLVDNMSSPTAITSYVAATFPFTVLEYSIVRDGLYRTGRMLIATDGTVSSNSDDFVDTADTGVVFSTGISGANVVIYYTTTHTGFNGTFKYSTRAWS